MEDFTLISKDFDGQKDYISRKGLTTKYNLNIDYQKGSFNINIDFDEIDEGVNFFSLIGDANLMQLVMFSASLVELYIQTRSEKYFADAPLAKKE
ncbi:MAG: hypothetical protein U9Q29_03295 [Campylobacterota bacterium]|nr:hypothetical protein [Campylobacterota bacterium]